MPGWLGGSVRGFVGTVSLAVGAVSSVYLVVLLVQSTGVPTVVLGLWFLGIVVLFVAGHSLRTKDRARRERAVLPSHYDIERYGIDRPSDRSAPTIEHPLGMEEDPKVLVCSECGVANYRSFEFCRNCQHKMDASER